MAQQAFDVINEQVILASIMQDPEVLRRALGSLREKDFISPEHQNIFESIRTCVREDIAVTIKNIAVNCDEGFGGIEYLSELMSMEHGGEDFAYYAKRLKKDVARVKACKDLEKLQEDLPDRSVDFVQCVKNLGDIFLNLKDATGGFQPSANTTQKYLRTFDKHCGGQSTFVSTGYESMDTVLTEGYARGRTVVIAGRTRTGKSTFIGDMLCRLVFGSFEGKIASFPLEGGPDRVLDMMVANITGIDTTRLVKFAHELTMEERGAVREAIQAIENTGKLDILENPFTNLKHNSNNEVLDKVEEIYAEGAYAMVVFDLWERALVQLNAQEIAHALFRQQALTEKYQTCTVIAQQLKRETEGRKEKRPTLTDLKSSGAYEEVADLVLLMHREKIYKPFMLEDIAEVIVAKQKRGMDNVTMLAEFDPTTCRLSNDRLGSFAEDDETVSPQFSEKAPELY
jgi:replicative DNA helicase